jgi:hypothetical protein
LAKEVSILRANEKLGKLPQVMSDLGREMKAFKNSLKR